MALADILRAGVAIINAQTQSVQIDVIHFARVGTPDVAGVKTFDAGTPRKCVHDSRNRTVRLATGEELSLGGMLIFVVPLTLQQGDEVQMPDGKRWPVVVLSGVIDPLTDKPFASEVGLVVGSRAR